jgi:hypothetical protein
MQIIGSSPAKSRPQNNRVIVIRSDTSSIFSRELGRHEEKALDIDRVELQYLRDELQDVGDCFEKEPTLAKYRIYRELLRKFAKKATSLAYRIEKKPIGLSNRTVEIVAIIDQKADELYHLVMQGQWNRLQVASRISNINGLLIQISA